LQKLNKQDLAIKIIYIMTLQELGEKSPIAYLSSLEDIEFQHHSTKIYEHKIEVKGTELSEIKETSKISKFEEGEEIILNIIILHTRSIGNRKLEIITINTESGEIVDKKLNTWVTSIKLGKTFVRSMNSLELKRFKIDWNKLWRPNIEDAELRGYSNHYPQVDNREKLELVSRRMSKIQGQNEEKFYIKKDELPKNHTSQRPQFKVPISAPNLGWETLVDVPVEEKEPPSLPENKQQIKDENEFEEMNAVQNNQEKSVKRSQNEIKPRKTETDEVFINSRIVSNDDNLTAMNILEGVVDPFSTPILYHLSKASYVTINSDEEG